MSHLHIDQTHFAYTWGNGLGSWLGLVDGVVVAACWFFLFLPNVQNTENVKHKIVSYIAFMSLWLGRTVYMFIILLVVKVVREINCCMEMSDDRGGGKRCR